MKHIIWITAASLALAGCFVQSRSNEHTTVVRRSCPPAHHWDGGACVHNGNGNGHRK